MYPSSDWGPWDPPLRRPRCANGHHVTVWNRTAARAEPLREAGAAVAPDLATAVGASPVVLVCVDDYAVTRQLLAQSDVRPVLGGRVLVQLSTGRPQEARDLQAWISASAAEYLDGATPGLSGPGRVGRGRDPGGRTRRDLSSVRAAAWVARSIQARGRARRRGIRARLRRRSRSCSARCSVHCTARASARWKACAWTSSARCWPNWCQSSARRSSISETGSGRPIRRLTSRPEHLCGRRRPPRRARTGCAHQRRLPGLRRRERFGKGRRTPATDPRTSRRSSRSCARACEGAARDATALLLRRAAQEDVHVSTSGRRLEGDSDLEVGLH